MLKVTFSSIMDKHQKPRPKPIKLRAETLAMANYGVFAVLEGSPWNIQIAAIHGGGSFFVVNAVRYDHMEVVTINETKKARAKDKHN